MLTGNDTFRYKQKQAIECPTNHPLLTSWVFDEGNCDDCGRTEVYTTGVNRDNEIEPKQMLTRKYVCDRCLVGEYYPVRV